MISVFTSLLHAISQFFGPLDWFSKILVILFCISAVQGYFSLCFWLTELVTVFNMWLGGENTGQAVARALVPRGVAHVAYAQQGLSLQLGDVRRVCEDLSQMYPRISGEIRLLWERIDEQAEEWEKDEEKLQTRMIALDVSMRQGHSLLEQEIKRVIQELRQEFDRKIATQKREWAESLERGYFSWVVGDAGAVQGRRVSGYSTRRR